MSSGPPIVCRPEPALPPDQARNARARAWKFVFDCYYAKKSAAGVTSTNGGDGTEIKGASAYERSIPE